MPGELLDAFGQDFSVIAYEHGYTDTPRPSVIQRICIHNAEAETAPPPLPA